MSSCTKLSSIFAVINAFASSVRSIRIQSGSRDIFSSRQEQRASVTGPLFTQSSFPPFLEPFTTERLGDAEGSEPLPASCGSSLEATLQVDQSTYENFGANLNNFFQHSFVFEGEGEKCGSDYIASDDSPQECRKKCAEDDTCTAFVVIIEAQAKQYCSPCLIYKANPARNCEKQYRKSTACKGKFIGAYSKSNDFGAGPSLHLADAEDSRFQLLQGHKLIRIGSTLVGDYFNSNRATSRIRLLNTIGDELTRADQITLGFEAGVDFRSCWGDMTDLAGDPVCGDQAMGNLMTSIGNASNAPSQDTAGQSGSTLIPNYKNFIIKNIMDDPEFHLLRNTMPKFALDIARRPQTCFGSALAPICAVMVEGVNAKWMLMRKIELPGAPRAARVGFANNKGVDHQVSWIDIKGPYFAQNLMDGKSQFAAWGMFKPEGDEDNSGWKHKDPGFVKIFPKGLHMKPTGSRDAGATLSFDTLMLTAEEMTDYSLFAQFYEVDASTANGPIIPSGSTTCGAGGAAKFPMIVEVLPEGIENRSTTFYMVIGIIDYIEQRVNTDAIGSRFSTMKRSWLYREYFMRMWPEYFKIPQMQFSLSADMQEGAIAAIEGMPGEKLVIGMRVMAIEEIKWTSSGRVLERAISYKYYYEQIVAKDNATSRTSGSKYKVLPGALGTLIAFVVPAQDNKANAHEASLLTHANAAIVIKWDPDTGVGKKVIKPDRYGVEKVFSVTADQVMTWVARGEQKVRVFT